MRRQRSGAGQGLAAGRRALAFMPSKTGNHRKAFRGRGGGEERSHLSFKSLTLARRGEESGEGKGSRETSREVIANIRMNGTSSVGWLEV